MVPGRDTVLERLRDLPPEPPGDGPAPDGASGVLLPLFRTDEDLQLLLTRRHPDLDLHPGQVSLPGGRKEPQDASLQTAALRETHEEVGIHPRRVSVLGHLTDMTTFYGAHVSAYVGLVDGEPPTEPASPHEVDAIILVPLHHLADGTGYESRIHPDEREGHRVHYWHLPQATVWGITGEIIARFLRTALDWHPPGKPRVVDSWEGFQP